MHCIPSENAGFVSGEPGHPYCVSAGQRVSPGFPDLHFPSKYRRRSHHLCIGHSSLLACNLVEKQAAIIYKHVW